MKCDNAFYVNIFLLLLIIFQELNNKSNVDLNLPVKTVSRKANWESSPSKNSMKKKSTDHNCEGVMVKMASG